MSKRPVNQNTPALRKKTSRFQYIALLVVVAIAAVGFWQRQYIYDWVKLRGYDAPATVAQLATQDTMTPYARKVFYVNRPVLEAKANFTQCKIGGEQTIVLGCYHGPQRGIYLLTVTDDRLAGVEQVTAAHEMLHAAYDRLSSSERKTINAQLEDYFKNGLKDERVRETINAYRTSEPNDVTNEMHSILGTEVASLPQPLEQYYTRYFTDRSKVAGYAAQYQAEFTSRQNAIKAADVQLASLKSQIDSLKASLASQQKSLKAESAQMEQYRANNNVQAFNAAVPGFNAAVNTYNDQVEQAQSLIATYNKVVNDRNAIVLEAQQLSNEIDSAVAPIDAK